MDITDRKLYKKALRFKTDLSIFKKQRKESTGRNDRMDILVLSKYGCCYFHLAFPAYNPKQ